MDLLYWHSDFSLSGGIGMKSKYWGILLFCLVVGCVSFSLFFLSDGTPSSLAEVTSHGQVIRTVDLNIDQEFTVSDDAGSNVITVQDGKIAVTWADCPDGYCVDRGFCNSGTQIVCLPHSLVITFIGETEVDFVVG